MADELTLQIKSTFDSLPPALEAVTLWLAERGAAPQVRYFTSLAVEEIATNCIKYGYDDSKDHLIQVSLRLSAEELELTITDDGHPFNPLNAPEPPLHLPAEERPIGGLGIHLVRKMSDQMEYTREGNLNRLTLRKGLSSTALPPT